MSKKEVKKIVKAAHLLKQRLQERQTCYNCATRDSLTSPPFQLPGGLEKDDVAGKVNRLLQFSLESQWARDISDQSGLVTLTAHLCLDALDVENEVVAGVVNLQGHQVHSVWLNVMGHTVDNAYVKDMGKATIDFLKRGFKKCYVEDDKMKDSLVVTQTATADKIDLTSGRQTEESPKLLKNVTDAYISESKISRECSEKNCSTTAAAKNKTQDVTKSLPEKADSTSIAVRKITKDRGQASINVSVALTASAASQTKTIVSETPCSTRISVTKTKQDGCQVPLQITSTGSATTATFDITVGSVRRKRNKARNKRNSKASTASVIDLSQIKPNSSTEYSDYARSSDSGSKAEFSETSCLSATTQTSLIEDSPESPTADLKLTPGAHTNQSNNPSFASCHGKRRRVFNAALISTHALSKMTQEDLSNFVRKRRIEFFMQCPDMALALTLNNCYANEYFFEMVRFMNHEFDISLKKGIDPLVRFMCWGCGRLPKLGVPFISNITGELDENDVIDSEDFSSGNVWQFSRCSKCNVASYCSVACQTKDWKRGHSLLCIQRGDEDLPSLGDVPFTLKGPKKSQQCG